jgi:hypothetical protein
MAAFLSKFFTPVFALHPRGVEVSPTWLAQGWNLRMYAIWIDFECLFFGAAIADAVSETFKVLRQGGVAPA